jgi:hypothetical protein
MTSGSTPPTSNGIDDDARVRQMAYRARQFRDRVIWPEGKPENIGIE